MLNTKGFTLIEMLIALFIAALISIALSVVFRIGMDFLARSRSYYSNLQESLAVVSYLRRSVSHAALDRVVGSAEMVFLQSGQAGTGSGLICQAADEGRWSLATLTVAAKSAQRNTAGGAADNPSTLPVGQLGANNDASQPVDEPALPPAERLHDATTRPLLDGLEKCSFEYLVAAPDQVKKMQAGNSSATEAAKVSAYVWSNARSKGPLAAIRVSLATRDAELPPVVLAPVK